MSVTQRAVLGAESSESRTVRAFLCYRRDDGSDAAGWLHRLLEGHSYRDKSGARCTLDVYFDQMEPGVADWKSHLQPSLESADAFIVVCSHALATDFSKDGAIDWPHRELNWWLSHRSAPPIAIDLNDNERYLPDRLRQKWPDLNRLLLDGKQFRGSAPKLDTEDAERLRERIVSTIIESESATVFQQLAKAKSSNRQLIFATVVAILGFATAGAGWWNADQSKKVALTQKDLSRHTVQFVTAMFAGADSQGQFGNALTVAQMLRPVSAKVETETSPLLKAILLRALASAHTGLGDSAAALSKLQQAEELLQKRGVRLDDEDEFRFQQSYGEAYLYSENEFEKALPHLQRAEKLGSSRGVDRSELATAKVSLGDFYAWSEEPNRAQARTYYDEALAMDRQAPANLIAVARDLNRLGNLAHDAQQDGDANLYFRQAYAALDAFPAATRALYAAQYASDFASVNYSEGNLDAALALYRQSADSFKSAYGDGSVEYGIAENNIARILIEQDKLEDAAPHAEASVRIEREAAGPNFSGLAFALNNFALTQKASGNLAAAEVAFGDAARVADDNSVPIGAQSLVHLAEIALAKSDWSRANDRLQKAATYFEKYGILDGWRYGLYQNAVGELRLRECKLDIAAELLGASSKLIGERWPGGNLFTRAATERNKLLVAEAGKAGSCGRNKLTRRLVRVG